MSGVNVVRYLLATNATLIATVPAAKIKAGIIPQGTALPAIAVSHVSTVRRNPVSDTYTFCRSRVQVTIMASNYTEQKSILAKVIDALPRTRGTVDGIDVDGILPDIEGPDFNAPDEGIYMQTMDFIVTFNE